MEESNFTIDNNGSLISYCQWIQYDSANELNNKVCEAEETTTQHDNRKVWIELTIFFKTITFWHVSAKCHGCCAFQWNLWVGVVVFEADC